MSDELNKLIKLFADQMKITQELEAMSEKIGKSKKKENPAKEEAHGAIELTIKERPNGFSLDAENIKTESELVLFISRVFMSMLAKINPDEVREAKALAIALKERLDDWVSVQLPELQIPFSRALN